MLAHAEIKDNVKLCWDFEYRMIIKETTAWRPVVMIEYKKSKLIQIIDIACPSDQNINKKFKGKLQKYQQLA